MRPTLTRRDFCTAFAAASAIPAAAARQPLNVLLITVDDMNWDSPGAFGGKVPGLTPNIDKLAASGLKFARAHVTVAVCQPSRSAIMTGRYPHRNGAEGFGPIREDVPTLQEKLRAAGYMNGIMAKNVHLAPRAKFCWDTYITPEELGQGRDPAAYYRHCTEFFTKAKTENRPFFLMANSQDPHRPFAGSDQEMKNFGKHLDYTRKIEPEQAVIPGFLPDIPEVRKEVAEYLTSVHRADQIVGQVLRALTENGFEKNTLVMFLSDNGMSFPYAKTNCYFNSTHTPWLARWPGVTKPGAVNQNDFISGIDFTPTILDATGLAPIAGVDGRSFAPLLRGQPNPGRDHVFTVFHETSGHKRYEMRCVQNAKYGYIYNGWSDGKLIFRNESQNGLTFNAMKVAGEKDPAIAERVRFFLYRTPEEFYDFGSDPSALRNRIGDPALKSVIAGMRKQMLEWMKRTGDPLAAKFEKLG